MLQLSLVLHKVWPLPVSPGFSFPGRQYPLSKSPCHTMAAQDLPTSSTGSGHAPSAEEQLDYKPQYEEVTAFSDPVPATKDQERVDIYANSLSDADSLALEQNPFLDPDVATHWTTVYEKSQYECRHVFDPSFTWTREEEKRLVRRLDWRVCLWAVSNQLPIIQLSPSANVPVYHVFRAASRSWKPGAGGIRQLPRRSSPEHQW